MVVACIYLLAWNYDRIKYIFPFNTPPKPEHVPNNKFPIKFFAGVFAFFVVFGYTITHVYNLMPRNTIADCESQCDDSEDPAACKAFCEGIHIEGKDFVESLNEYEQAVEKYKK